MSNRLACFTVFVASGAVLVLEILAGRLLAPYLGVTLQTFTGIIGVVLAGIAAGTFIGGRLADRHDPRRLLPLALGTGGALAIASVPLIRLFGPGLDGGPASIVFLSGVSFLLPSAALSAVSPMVVKVRLDSVEHTGQVVGQLSAIGTAGSIVGVFTTGFVFVAAFPTTPVVIAVGGSLVVLGAALWVRFGRLGPGDRLLGCAALALGAGALGVAGGSPCDVESTYFCATVRVDPDRPSGRVLILDTLRNSYVDLDDPTHLEFTYAQVMGDVLDAVAPGTSAIDAVHIGGGGFTLPRYIEATRTGSNSIVFELDPTIVELAEGRLGLVRSASLQVVTGDARVHLRALPAESADLVIGDAFGGEAVPWHLTTKQFVNQIAAVMRPDAVYAINLIDHPPLGFARAEVATLRSVFAHVAVIAPSPRIDGRDGGNFVLLASDEALPLQLIRDLNAGRGDDDIVVGDRRGLDDFTRGARVLTDEHAPVDQLITAG